MDLEYNHFPDTARSLIRWYVKLTDDVGALPLLPFFCCYRAMVRCKVSCFTALEGGSQEADPDMLAAAGRYLAMAHGYATAFTRPLLWLVCGPPAETGNRTVGVRCQADPPGSLQKTLRTHHAGRPCNPYSRGHRKPAGGLSPANTADRLPDGQLYTKRRHACLIALSPQRTWSPPAMRR